MITIINRKINGNHTNKQIHQISVDKNQIEKEKGNERKVKIKYVHGVKKNFWIQRVWSLIIKLKYSRVFTINYDVQLEDEKRNMCYKLWNQ